MLHHQAVNDDQRHGDDRSRARPRRQINDRREEIADRDALQHAGNANRGKLKVRKAGEKFAEQKNDYRADRRS